MEINPFLFTRIIPISISERMETFRIDGTFAFTNTSPETIHDTT